MVSYKWHEVFFSFVAECIHKYVWCSHCILMQNIGINLGDVHWKVGDTPEIYFMQAIECVCLCVSAQLFFILVQVLYPKVRGWIENIYEGESYENLQLKSVDTALCASAGTASHQLRWEVCPVCGRSGTVLKKWQRCTESFGTHSAGKKSLRFTCESPIKLSSYSHMEPYW
jgi:hypothetical protein